MRDSLSNIIFAVSASKFGPLKARFTAMLSSSYLLCRQYDHASVSEADF